MKLTSFLITLVFVFFPPKSAAQQYGSTGISVHGSVSRKVMMSPAAAQPSVTGSGNLTAQLIRSGDERVVLRLQGAAQPGASIVSARLLLRTNTAYDLRASLVSSVNAPSMAARVANVSATGAWVAPTAVESVKATRSPIAISNESILLASGSRISRGAATSPNNAIEIELRIDVSSSDAAWTVDMTLEIISR